MEKIDLLKKIIETVGTIYDFDNVLNVICMELQKVFQVDRVGIVRYVEAKNEWIIVDEYSVNNNIPSSKDIYFSQKFTTYIKNILIDSEKDLIIDNLDEADLPDFVKEEYKQLGAKSILSFSLKRDDDKWGALVLFQNSYYRHWTEEDIELLHTVIQYIYIIIKRSEVSSITKKQAERERILREIIEILRSSIDPVEIKKYFVEIIGHYFDADRCLFIDYSKEAGKSLPFRIERLKSNDIQSFAGINPEREFPEFVAKSKKGKNIIVKDVEKTYLRKKFIEYKSLETLYKYGVKSDYGLSVKYKGEFYGTLIIHFTTEKRILSHDELAFLKVLKNQVGIALYQAELYSTTKKRAEREILLRKIVEKIRSSLAVNEIKTLFVNSIGSFFKADRILFSEFNPQQNMYMPVDQYSEYLSSSKEKSFIGYDWSKPEAKVYMQPLMEKQELNIYNLDEYLERNPKGPEFVSLFKDSDVQSSYNIPVLYFEELMGYFCIEFTKREYRLTEEDLEFIRAIVNQAGIALNQAKLYETIKKQAEREVLLRNITEKIRSSLDINETLGFICDEVAKLFNVQRATITEFTDPDNYENYIIRREYSISPEIKGLLSVEYDKRAAVYWASNCLKKEKCLTIDNIPESDTPDYFKENYIKLGVKSMIGFPIKREEHKWGMLVLSEYNYYRHWTKEDRNLLESIADQLYIAIKQAELYNTLKQTAEREALLRRITETIRSTLDIDKTLTVICDEVAKLFNVQRATIIEFPDPDNFEIFKVRREYTISPEIKKLGEIGFDKKSGEYWANTLLKKNKYLAIENIQESNLPAFFKNSYNIMGVKSIIGIPIKSEQYMWGTLTLSEYNYRRHWIREDVALLESIASQIYIAIKQAELYNTVKQTAEREALSRRVTETIRSSLDVNEIKKKIVYEIGKTFKADRCYFRVYDKKRNLFLAPDIEYLSSSAIKSLINIEPDQEGLKYFSDEVMKRKKGSYPIVVDKDFAKKSDYIEQYFKSAHIKAIYAVPIYDNEDELIYLVLHYVKKDPELSEDDKLLLENLANQTAIAIDHAKLFSETQESKNRETLLKTIINEILTSRNIDEAYYRISAHLTRIFNVDRTALSLYDPGLKVFLGLIGEYRVNERVPSARNITNPFTEEINTILNDELVNKKRVFIIENVNDSKYSYTLKEQLNSVGAKSTVWMPIIYKDNIIAVIFLTNTESYKVWPESEINLLESLVKQIAIGINLFKFADESNRLLTTERALKDIVTIARQSESHDQLYSYVLENISQIFNVDRAMHLHYTATGDVLIINEYIKEDSLKSLKNEIILTKENARNFVLNVFNKAIIINDVNKDIQETELKDYLLNNMIIAFVIYPVIVYSVKSEQTLGAAMICSKSPRIWTSNEIETLKLILDTTILVYQEIKQRKEAEQVKQTFLATLTHDLRSPIIAEQKALEAIQSGKLGTSLDNFSVFLQDIYKTNEELLRIVNNILSVYHYESGKFELKLESSYVNDMINDSVRSMKSLAKDQESEIITNIQEDIPIVMVDRGEIIRVVINLISNAIKHNKKGTSIKVEAKRIDDKVQISVSDNGKGIPEAERPKIFLRYPTEKRKIGTGLGLYLSKQIIDAHKGRIWFETEEGKGTTFYFTLPIIMNNE